jgi:hypothetical protein
MGKLIDFIGSIALSAAFRGLIAFSILHGDDIAGYLG